MKPLVCFAAALALAGCGGASTRWLQRPPADSRSTLPSLVFVLTATGPRRVEVVDGRPREVVGVGGQWSAAAITERVALIVRERYPGVRILDTFSEENAAVAALDAGATHVLVTTVREWREGSRIDGEGDRVAITLALAVPERLPPGASVQRGLPAARLRTVAAIDFRTHGSGVAAAFSMTDRRASRLLDGRFHDAVLDLIRGVLQS